MNEYMHRPMPYGVKLRKLWAGKFYLAPADREELTQRIDWGEYTREEQVVGYVDEHGEWLD